MKLFIPGPVEVRREVLEAMRVEMISHRSKEASSWQLEIEEYLRYIWNTKKDILLSTSSGTGLMEGSLLSCSERAAIFSMGAFGDRFFEIAKAFGIDADLFKVEWGRPIDLKVLEEAALKDYDTIVLTHNETSTGVLNPMDEISKIINAHPEKLWILDSVSATGGVVTEVDKWGVDIIITSSQKCLGLPPGLAFCTFSEKARERAMKKKNRGYYFDLLLLDEYREKKHQYPQTPNLSLMNAARVQLKYIVEEEGLANRIKRHQRMAHKIRTWARENARLFADESALSNTLTTVAMEKTKMQNLIEEMKKRGYLLSAGYGELRDKNFRIAHMADRTLEELDELIYNLNDCL